MPTQTPEWVEALPDTVAPWALSLMSRQRPGFFRSCIDAQMDFDFPSSGVCRAFLATTRPSELEALAPFRDDAIAFVQSCQQPATALFIDPDLDSRFLEPDAPAQLEAFRRAVSKYTGWLARSSCRQHIPNRR